MEDNNKHKELNAKLVELLTEHLGHKQYGYMLHIIDLSREEDSQFVITNIPEDPLLKYMIKATEQLAKNMGKT